MHLSSTYKTMNGRIEIEADVENDVIMSLKLGGDFYMRPEGAMLLLSRHLSGVELKREFVTNAINTFFLFNVESLNATKTDIIEAILLLRDMKSSAKI